MSDPFLGEVRMFGFGFAPVHWAQCNGQLMPVSQNRDLFNLIGYAFGGSGGSFAIPNFTGGGAPIGVGQGPGLTDRALGSGGGQAAVKLAVTEVPAHTHRLLTANPNFVANVATPGPTLSLARANGGSAYAPAANLQPMADGVVSPGHGNGTPHNNLMPYQVVNYCICLNGQMPHSP